MNQTQAEQCPGSKREWVKKNGVMTCQGCDQTWDLWREKEPREGSGQTIPWHGRKIVAGAKKPKRPDIKAKSPFESTYPMYREAVARTMDAMSLPTFRQRFTMGIEDVQPTPTAADRAGARPTFIVTDEAVPFTWGTVPTVPFTQEEVTGFGYPRASDTSVSVLTEGALQHTNPPSTCPVCAQRRAQSAPNRLGYESVQDIGDADPGAEDT